MQYNSFDVDSQIEVQKKKKVSKLLIGLMVLIFVFIIAIICIIMYIQQGAFRVYIDGNIANLPENTIIIEPSGKVYVSIKDIATSLGYQAHNGEYKLYSEDTNKCYVDSKNETASFFLNSNKISKMPPDQTKDYADYTITDPVISKNGKLYCSAEGIKIGFNVTFSYNQETNKIQIYTLPQLVQMYNSTMVGYGYQPIFVENVTGKNFNNQKAILYNMFVVKKEKGLYGVVDKDNKEIISSKYADMEFNENLNEFYVTSTTKKQGIVTAKGVTKINLIYDSVEMIDKDNELYLVSSSGKYGVLGNKGDVIIHLEYQKIGIDATQFTNNNIKNKYLLLDNTIPVMQNNKWGLFDKTGKLLVPVEYDYMGYVSTETGNSNSLLVIPSYKCIVLGIKQEGQDKKNSRYGIFDYEGNQIIATVLDKAYSVTSAGVNTYYMEHNGQKINIEDYIKNLYEKQGKTKPTDEAGSTSNTNSTNINNTNTAMSNTNL